MYCTNCGTSHGDEARSCVNCGTALPRKAPDVSSYLIPAILVTLCCCVPLGIPAIVFAAQVEGRLAGGDVEGAMESSRRAKRWCWIALASGLAVGVLYLLLAIGLPGMIPS